MADTNINIKPSALVAGLAVVVVTILSWSLSIVYDNLVDEIHSNREKIKVQWALISENKKTINNLRVEIASEHADRTASFGRPNDRIQIIHQHVPVHFE